MADSITSVLPADTIFWIRAPDWARTTVSVQRLPMLRLLSTAEMKMIRDQTGPRSRDYLIDSFGLDFQSIDQEISGEFVIAGLTTERGEVSISCFVEAMDEAIAEEFVQSTAALLIERGAKAETAAVPGTIQFLLKDAREQLVVATLGRRVMLSGEVLLGF